MPPFGANVSPLRISRDRRTGSEYGPAASQRLDQAPEALGVAWDRSDTAALRRSCFFARTWKRTLWFRPLQVHLCRIAAKDSISLEGKMRARDEASRASTTTDQEKALRKLTIIDAPRNQGTLNRTWS
jgi:hypothetical protein